MSKGKKLTRIDSLEMKKACVIGPGIVGMPMAAMLAHARIKTGPGDPLKVIIVQRNSVNSGWKVDAVNSGKSVIGGIEPGLDEITGEAVREGLLSASHDYAVLSDADLILISVQTDKKGFAPDYGPLFGALEDLCKALVRKPAGKVPLIVFESTLAPTTMDTLIRDYFKKFGLEEGRDILLGNSPNRVMPGRLVERIRSSDKLAGGLSPETPKLISGLYSHIVREGKVLQTNSLTAEIVKTLENAYRDVRIAFSTEIARYCDSYDIDFYSVRDKVNSLLNQSDDSSHDPVSVPKGGILIPLLGVGGHCLPKDGILLWWRKIETNADCSRSLILESRRINDESPVHTFRQAESALGSMKDKRIALMGVAYRFNSEDTRNSPTLVLADHLRANGISYIMHDPYVKPDDQNLLRFDQEKHFTHNRTEALENADFVFMCTAHEEYSWIMGEIASNKKIKGLMDACNIYPALSFQGTGIAYCGIGKGKKEPGKDFIAFVADSFQSMERGVANELMMLINFFNRNYVHDSFNKVDFFEVQRLAGTCTTGCVIADPGPVPGVPEYKGFSTRLAHCAFLAGRD
jgi:UDP-N-acetyl-D-mannosaminuronic acid dehydrogenase